MHRLNVPGKEAVFRFKGISLFEFLACNARDRRAELQADGALTGKRLEHKNEKMRQMRLQSERRSLCCYSSKHWMFG